jgi:hypothetical protein
MPEYEDAHKKDMYYLDEPANLHPLTRLRAYPQRKINNPTLFLETECV